VVLKLSIAKKKFFNRFCNFILYEKETGLKRDSIYKHNSHWLHHTHTHTHTHIQNKYKYINSILLNNVK